MREIVLSLARLLPVCCNRLYHLGYLSQSAGLREGRLTFIQDWRLNRRCTIEQVSMGITGSAQDNPTRVTDSVRSLGLMRIDRLSQVYPHLRNSVSVGCVDA